MARVKTQSEDDFGLVTAVNYKTYFLCVQHAAPGPCAATRRPEYCSNIIQINSKSGWLRARAGGGRDQGELHVPGELLRGPAVVGPEERALRSSRNPAGVPLRGNAPGGKTIDDVKRFYEVKLRMKEARLQRRRDAWRLLPHRAGMRDRTGAAGDRGPGDAQVIAAALHRITSPLRRSVDAALIWIA
jgi:hypothetical protein